jgi:hypothetical protein
LEVQIELSEPCLLKEAALETGRQGIAGNGGASHLWKGGCVKNERFTRSRPSTHDNGLKSCDFWRRERRM